MTNNVFTLANNERLYILKQVNKDLRAAKQKSTTQAQLEMLYNIQPKFSRKG